MLRILHTNDFHGALSADRAAFIRELKGDNALYFDSGDVIKAGNLAIPMKEEVAWSRLVEAGCDASTLGNRESHVVEMAFERKLKGCHHPIVVANLVRQSDGAIPAPLQPSLTLVRGSLRIGVVGVMVPMVTARMASRAASAYLWSSPVEAAREHGEALRPEVDVLILLSHIGYRNDVQLAGTMDCYDLILGGHSHTVLSAPERVGRTWIAQAGSHGRYVGEVLWEDDRVEGRLIELPAK